MLRVFISSTIKDLHFVRQTLADKIESLLGHDVVISESVSFDWTSRNIVESCLKEVRNSDVYVLVIGERIGTLLDQEHISITQAEFRQARADKKPIFVVIMNETWILFEQTNKIDEHLRQFISEVGSNFNRNLKRFSSSEEAFEYVRAQMSILLKNYLKLGIHHDDVHDIINKGRRYEGYYRFLISLLSNSLNYSEDFNRILSSFSREIKCGDIYNNEFVPESLVRLTDTTGGTLYRLSENQKILNKIGVTGDIGGHDTYNVDDTNSYVSDAFLRQEAKLFKKERPGELKEYIMCIPMAEKYIVSLHFLVDQEYQSNYDQQLILNGIFNKNKILFDILNLYLEKGGNYEE
jgi:hypothetical protein